MVADLTRRASLERASHRHYVQSMAARMGLFLGLLVLLTVGYTGYEARAAGDTVIVTAAIPVSCEDCKDCAGTTRCHSTSGVCTAAANCAGLYPVGLIENDALAPYRTADLHTPGTATGLPGLAVKPPLHPPKAS